MTFTKEQLIARISQVTAINKFRIKRDPDADGLAMDNELLAIALAALAGMEAVPVAWKVNFILEGQPGSNFDQIFENSAAMNDAVSLHKLGGFSISITPFYAAPQTATVVPGCVASAIENLKQKLVYCNRYNYCSDAVNRVDEACRAAMLQGKAEPVSNRDALSATQFKPVADLYGITSPTGSETSFTFDAVEARDFIDGGWSCQEYVELERYQDAVTGNSPVIPDGWVIVPVEPTAEMLQSGISAHYERSQIQIHDRPAPGPMECAYLAMVSAAQQEESRCSCRTCRPVTMNDMRFVVCPQCGNKRCPHANDCRNACTGSNEPGQEGSAYPAEPHQEAE